MRQYDIENEQSAEKLKPQHYEWHQVFYTLFTQPKLETFQRLLQDPQAKAQRAYLWMLLPSIMSGVTSQAIAAQIFGSDWITIILLGSLVGGIFSIAGFIVSGWIIQRVAVALGGDKNGYGKFHYARGTFMPVLVLAYAFINLLLGSSSLVIYVFAALLTVELMLTGFALRAVNSNLSWNQIILSIFIWYFMIIVVSTTVGSLF